MPKWLLLVTTYLLVLVNLALGLLMFALSHQAIMLVLDVLRQGALLENVDIFTYFQGAVSSFSALLLGLLGMIAFPALEHYYSRAKSGQTLLLRFLRVTGIQLVYIATVQLLGFGLLRAYGGVPIPSLPLFAALTAFSTGILLTHYLSSGQ